MRLIRLLFWVGVFWGGAWVAKNVPVGGETLWQRGMRQVERVKKFVYEVDRRLDSKEKEKTEVLRPDERREVRDIVRERSDR